MRLLRRKGLGVAVASAVPVWQGSNLVRKPNKRSIGSMGAQHWSGNNKSHGNQSSPGRRMPERVLDPPSPEPDQGEGPVAE